MLHKLCLNPFLPTVFQHINESANNVECFVENISKLLSTRKA